VTFRVGSETFKAHKAILAARSPVMSSMFEAGGLEATTGEVTIEDIDPVAFKQVLRFVYTDACEAGAMEAMADHLLPAARKYQLERLQRMSEAYLSAMLTAENAAQRLRLAELHGSDKLKQSAMEYITSNLDDVEKTEAYKELDAPLLRELISTQSKKRPREESGYVHGRRAHGRRHWYVQDDDFEAVRRFIDELPEIPYPN